MAIQMCEARLLEDGEKGLGIALSWWMEI